VFCDTKGMQHVASAPATGFPTASPLLDTHHQQSNCSEHLQNKHLSLYTILFSIVRSNFYQISESKRFYQLQDLAIRMSPAHSLALHTAPEDGADEVGCESCWGTASGALGCWTAGCSWQAGSQRLPGRACKQTEVLLLRRATSHSCRLLGMMVVCVWSSSHRVTAVLALEQRCDVSSLGATVHVRRSMSEESNQLVERLSLCQSRPVPGRRAPTSTAVTQTIAVPLMTTRQSDIGTCQFFTRASGPQLPEDRGLWHTHHPALPALYTSQQCGR